MTGKELLRPRLRRLVVVLIAVVAIGAFGTGINWGLPQAVNPETVQPWALDTIAPIAPLNEAYYRFTRTGNEYVVYPLFHYIVLSVAYAPYIGIQFVSGDFAEPSSTFPYGIEDVVGFSRDLTVIARLVSLAMALGIVFIVYRIALRLAGHDVALWAALASALLAPMSFYAKTSNLDVPYAFWVCLGVLSFLRILDGQRLKDYLLLALFTALAVATKDQAYGFFVLIPFVLAYARAQSDAAATPSLMQIGTALVSRPMVLAGATALVADAAANNLFFGGFDGLIRHLNYGGEIYDYRQGEGDGLYTLTGQIRLLGRTGLVFVQMLGPVSVALAVAGIVLVARDRDWRLLSLLAFVVSYYLFVIAAFNLVFSRYLLVPALLLTPFIGVAIRQMLAASRQLRPWAVLVISAALLSQLALVVNLNLTLVADSRNVMAEWIRTNVPAGATIESQVRERMLPHISADYRVMVAGNSENTITMAELPDELTPAALAARNPDYVLILKGLGVTGDPAGWDDPALRSYYADLVGGRVGYEKVAEFPTPAFIPFRQIPGTRPTSILLARSGTSGR